MKITIGNILYLKLPSLDCVGFLVNLKKKNVVLQEYFWFNNCFFLPSEVAFGTRHSADPETLSPLSDLPECRSTSMLRSVPVPVPVPVKMYLL